MGLIYVNKTDVALPNKYDTRYVGCPIGYKLIGGGGGGVEDYSYFQTGISNKCSGPDPDNSNQWGILFNNTSNYSPPITYYAICAKVQ